MIRDLMAAADLEDERLTKLRAFLLERRSRLRPGDVGLPQTGRRRVTGLRREEVAELAGVSSDWYRWFESGRTIRVSPAFLARLGQALRLSAEDQRALFCLAVPELYEADLAQRMSLAHLPLVTPVRSTDEIPGLLRRVHDAKTTFYANDASAVPMVRPRILNSWRRSRKNGVDPFSKEHSPEVSSGDALTQRRDENRSLLEAAAPLFASLEGMLKDAGFAIVLADAQGIILELSAKPDVLRRLSRINFEPGFDLRESACGTNAVGTSIVDGRPLQLIGDENFSELGSDLTCTGAPIRDPSTHEIIGVLDVTADYRLFYPQMLALVGQTVLEIEERLAWPVSV